MSETLENCAVARGLNQIVGNNDVQGVVLDTGTEQYAGHDEAAGKLRDKLGWERR